MYMHCLYWDLKKFIMKPTDNAIMKNRLPHASGNESVTKAGSLWYSFSLSPHTGASAFTPVIVLDNGDMLGLHCDLFILIHFASFIRFFT